MSYGVDKQGRAYCKWNEGKKQRIEYFGRGDVALRKAISKDEQIKMGKGKLKVDGGLTVAQVCQQYASQHHMEPSTASSTDYRLRTVILPILGDIPVDGLNTKHLNEYITTRVADGRKKITIDRELDILKAAFNWAQLQDPPLIFRNPVQKFKLSAKDKDVPPPPNSEEIARILFEAPEHLQRAIRLNYHLMCRPGGEISRITWADVDFVSNEIRIIGARKGGPAIRYVQMRPELRELLEQWKAADENGLKVTRKKAKPVIHNLAIVHYRYKPVKSLKRAWKETKDRAKVFRRLRLYDLRHAGITKALKSGADVKAVSEVAGHSRVDTTLRVYQHVTHDQHLDAVMKIPHIPNLLKSTSSRKGSN